MPPRWGGSRRTPRGVRGLKFVKKVQGGKAISRTPRGVRGLKYGDDYTAVVGYRVAPREGCVD